MGALFRAALNRFIRDKPSIAAAPQIASARVPPARNVRFVLIRDSDGEPVQFDPPHFCEMKNVFVAIVQKPLRTDRLEMAERFYRGLDPHLALRVRLSLARERIEVRVRRAKSARRDIDPDRFDPMNCVLQNESA